MRVNLLIEIAKNDIINEDKVSAWNHINKALILDYSIVEHKLAKENMPVDGEHIGFCQRIYDRFLLRKKNRLLL